MNKAKLIAEVRNINPALARELQAALGMDAIERHMSEHQSLPALRKQLQTKLKAAYLEFVVAGLKTLGEGNAELDYGDTHPGLERNASVKKLASELKAAIREMPLPDDSTFWV